MSAGGRKISAIWDHRVNGRLTISCDLQPKSKQTGIASTEMVEGTLMPCFSGVAAKVGVARMQKANATAMYFCADVAKVSDGILLFNELVYSNTSASMFVCLTVF